MQDIKKQLGLGGDHNWPHIPIVKIQGDPSARKWTQGDQSGIIESWQKVLVLRVGTADTQFVVGFKNGDNMQILSHSIQTRNGKFGMRIGDGDVEFFIVPRDLSSPLLLDVVEITKEDDPAYADLPLY